MKSEAENMITSHIKSRRLLALVVSAIGVFGCSDQSSNSSQKTQGISAQTLTLSDDTPFAYVQRSVTHRAESNFENFKSSLTSTAKAPLDLSTPYDLNLCAKLIVRTSLDFNGVDVDILMAYFHSATSEVKYYNFAPDGQFMFVAVHAPEGMCCQH